MLQIFSLEKIQRGKRQIMVRSIWALWPYLVLSLFLFHPVVEGKRASCPRISDVTTSTKLQAADPNGRQGFWEVSGLGMSPKKKAPSGQPVLYTVNDSGGGKRLGIYDSGSGKRLLTLRLSFLPSETDYESMAVGSCGSTGTDSTCIYIGDFGDNKARNNPVGTKTSRSGVPYQIFKIQEPDYSDFNDNQKLPTSYFHSVMEFDYDHFSSPTKLADCEALFLDHTGWGGGEIGDLYMVSKYSKNRAKEYTRLFKIPMSAWPSSNQMGSKSSYSPKAVGKAPGGMGISWTRADMSLDGSVIALGDIKKTYLFLRCPGMSVAETLNGNSCHSWSSPRSDNAKQYEAFAWTPDGSRTLQMSECDGCDPVMVWTKMNYDEGQECSQTQEEGYILEAESLVESLVEWAIGSFGPCLDSCEQIADWQCISVEAQSVLSDEFCTTEGLDRPVDKVRLCEECPSTLYPMVSTSVMPSASASTVPTVYTSSPPSVISSESLTSTNPTAIIITDSSETLREPDQIALLARNDVTSANCRLW
eukprot:CAMPEP_0198299536 /NCGR_PEP_ID=MMETSP1449-20131203/45134_1 /TAXON_ID=420275 /ORGANISM="Attheya septentrionalis, Strain CCMP2084" /LENGTH=530 /DNA_ID=CAMNT_0044001127 /DNA_START=79 /DNA_END=1668 /DNA_ORIENTATION=+